MFTPDERERLRDRLVARARADARITGAALTGSAARGEEDRWSDVDLFLGVADDVTLEAVLADWTESLYDEENVVHHWDVPSGAAIYRVFLLENTLQVDVAFTPASSFGPRGPAFRVVFGEPVEMPRAEPPNVGDIAGLAWLGVIHASKAIERHRPWEAVHWIGTIRDQILALSRLPSDAPPATHGLEETLVLALDPAEVRRALGAATRCLLGEIRRHDPDLEARLVKPLLELAEG